MSYFSPKQKFQKYSCNLLKDLLVLLSPFSIHKPIRSRLGSIIPYLFCFKKKTKD